MGAIGELPSAYRFCAHRFDRLPADGGGPTIVARNEDNLEAAMQEWEQGLEKLKHAYSAWHQTKGGSVETWVKLMADEVDCRTLAANLQGVPWAQSRTTPDGVREYLTGLTSEWEMDHFTVDRFVCQDDTIVMIGSTGWHHRRATEKKLDTPKLDVWRFKDGKAVSLHEYLDTAAIARCLAELG